MGDVDLVRALGLAGISSALVGAPGEPARFSRHVRTVLPAVEGWQHHDETVAVLLRFGRAQPEPPVLYPQTDAALLLASRHREELGQAFRLMLADSELVEQLVDKARFQALAERCGLPVPPARRLRAETGQPPPVLDLSFPLVMKPAVRSTALPAAAATGKALHIAGPGELAALWPQLAENRAEVLVQEEVSGPETAIESYHAYVDERGLTVGEFTGRKIRTFPLRYGHSTAVEIIELPDVAELGREVLRRVGLRGVAKADFKRDERGVLHLLEINPRFTLWHHAAALAGVNVPALVYADLTGSPRPLGQRATRRVAWCKPLGDLRAALAEGMSPLGWLRWARSCTATSALSWDDPLPFLCGTLVHAVWRRVPRVGGV
jgi:D-aspartate ligase